MKEIELKLPQGGVRKIGNGHPIFIAAEIGITCNYQLTRAKNLIDIASNAGADAVKLAFHFPEELLSDHSVTYKYSTTKGTREENMYEMFDYLRFTYEEWVELKSYADSKNMFMFCSMAGGFGGIDWSDSLDLPMYKVGAWDLLDLPQWNMLKKSKKPIVIDVGTVTEEEMDVFMEILKNTPTILLHEYHSENFEEMNLNSIPYIKSRYDTLVGFSSPDSYDGNDFISVALGAVCIEKRLTISRNDEGHHHILSKEPSEFKQWVTSIRNSEKAMGTLKIQPTKKDLEERSRFFKRVVASKEINVGDVFTEANICCKRPSTNGISSRYYYDLIGKVSDKQYKYNDPISNEELI